MDSTLKTILKAAAVFVIPGALVYLVATGLAKDAERREFREYVKKTYGEGSNYVDRYQF